MRGTKDIRHIALRLTLVVLLVVAALPALRADEAAAAPAPKKAEEAKAAEAKAQAASTEAKARLDVYGFAMLDMGYETGQADPNWFDTARPTKLPAYTNEFGKDGHWFMGVRQSRLGFKSFIPTGLGEIKTIFEFELFGTGVDAGQTTFRLRHAWAELGQFGAGQFWSAFVDPDQFPNTIEYWGPNAIVWFRNVQFRWTPVSGDTTVAIALERPGASADQGIYRDRIELQGITPRFPLPDLTAHILWTRKWGHAQIAGLVRRMMWDDTNGDKYDLSGKAFGWGLNLSGVYNVAHGALRGSVVVGEGVQNYMNDAPVDIGIQNNFTNPVTPVVGVPLPLLGLTLFYDHTWNDKFTSSLGASYLDIKNSDAQAGDAFRRGYYAVVNLLYHPAPSCFLGPELQWIRRENFSDGFRVNDFKIQFSARYDFKASIGGN
jgi:DcaP outer membrane protein